MKLGKTFLTIIALLGTVTACATNNNNSLITQNPSGRPEGVFFDSSMQNTNGKISSGCMNMGWTVVSPDKNQVICEIKLNLGKSILAQLAIGNKYSTTPRQFIRFSLAQIGSDVRVQASSWIETQMSFGQVSRAPVDQTVKQINELQSVLWKFGAMPVKGATYIAKLKNDSNPHAYIGVSLMHKAFERKTLVYVFGVFSGSPAEISGIIKCDIIKSLNGKTFPDEKGLIDIAKSLSPGKAYPIKILRDKKILDMSITPISADAAKKLPATRFSLDPTNNYGCSFSNLQ